MKAGSTLNSSSQESKVSSQESEVRSQQDGCGADHLAELNTAQKAAVTFGIEPGAAPGPPLLVIAGAGSGKTKTLAHRVAHLMLHGAQPDRILLLTFTRRAAHEMKRRAERICRRCTGESPPAGFGGRIRWAGTFHSVANRLLRRHAESVGLTPSFTVLDRSDAADLLDLLRDDLGFSRAAKRFPKKATCLAIYSHCVNAEQPLEKTLADAFPWCEMWADRLRTLFRSYVDAKQERNVLDYDDLLLYWHHLMSEPALAAAVRERFDHVLVDEYQDTNALQARILLALQPQGRGLTVVGDDAQAIYSFRAATVRNILDFPGHFDPPAAIVTLEQNYRSVQPILDLANAVIEQAGERFTKNLHSNRQSVQRPMLVTAEDEPCEAEYVADRILEHREAGTALRRQAVLFRAAHHSDLLEIELGRRNIPFVKFGGLKFLEAAHVKDLICLLRWAENPRDTIAAFRILQLLPGFGPGTARRALDHLRDGGFDFAALRGFRPPAATASGWPDLCGLLRQLHDPTRAWQGQLAVARAWYEPHLHERYDAAQVRAGDLEQLEQIAASYPSRERFLTELTLDPPAASADEAGDPHLDEDFLILSTIHSAKGQEWDVVYVIHAADGCIPADLATRNAEQIDEERRVFYVALTRARNHLYVVHPQRFYKREQRRYGDQHVLTPLTRFIPDSIVPHCERRAYGRTDLICETDGATRTTGRVDVAARLREMW